MSSLRFITEKAFRLLIRQHATWEINNTFALIIKKEKILSKLVSYYNIFIVLIVNVRK